MLSDWLYREFRHPAMIQILARWAKLGLLDRLIENGGLDQFAADMIITYR